MCQRVCAECPLGQGIKQLAVRWERRPPWWLMYTTLVVLSVQTSTCLSCILKHPGEVAARPQNEKLQHFVSSSTGQQPPLMHRNTNAHLLSCRHSQRFAESLSSEAKSCCAFARALLLYPHCGAGCAWRNMHANCHWLVLLTLEGDWALGRDPISQSH